MRSRLGGRDEGYAMRRDLFIIINLCVSVALCFRFFRRRSRLGGRDEGYAMRQGLQSVAGTGTLKSQSPNECHPFLYNSSLFITGVGTPAYAVSPLWGSLIFFTLHGGSRPRLCSVALAGLINILHS